tara:strand:+ start:250 stop:396 length:147 start_codon:yes stop_codon:yes gene_type:complete
MFKNGFLWFSIAFLMYFGFDTSLKKSTEIDCLKYKIEKACKTFYEVKS